MEKKLVAGLRTCEADRAGLQPFFSFVLFVTMILVCLQLSFSGARLLSVSLLIGVGIGFAFQRSRFCLTAAFRDIILFRNAEVAIHTVFLLFLLSCGFLIIYFYSYLKGSMLPVHITSIGLHTILGAFLFGIGMVIAGGCATGMMMRLGECHVQQVFTLVGFLVGSVAGAWHRFYWNRFINSAPKIFLPALLGWGPAVLLQMSVFLCLYLFLQRYRYRIEKEKSSGRFSLHSITRGIWSYKTGAVAIALLSTLLYLYRGRAYGVTTGLTYWGTWMYTKLGGDVSNWVYYQSSRHQYSLSQGFLLTTESMLNAGFIAGAFISVLAAAEGRIRKIRSGKHAVLALAGGLLMGYGSRMSQGCNIGAFLSAISSFSVEGWVYGVGVFCGAYLGTRILLHVFAGEF